MAALWFNIDQFVAADHLDHAITYHNQLKFAEALIGYDLVLGLEPSNKYARWNRVLARLSVGDYVNGLPEHDCAWDVFNWHPLGNIDRIMPLPVWKGERCNLFVYHEMGFGDAIMCLRFLPEIVQRCEDVTLMVRPELVSLMQGYGADVIDYIPNDVHEYDARVTIFNSIHTMGHSLQTIPHSPYIHADFQFAPDRKRVGIAWSGNSRTELNLESFLSRLNLDGFEVYALQRAEPVSGIVPLRAGSFKDTVALMQTLDAIVSVDTAAAHLAGAIGHPNAHVVIPFNRDWRWWNRDAWYPTLKIYPQDNPMDWNAPFQRVNESLRGV